MQPPPTEISDPNTRMFRDIATLWGDPSYIGFQKQLKRTNRPILVVLYLFGLMIRFAPTRMLAIYLAILGHPKLCCFDPKADVLFYGPTKNNLKVLQQIAALLPAGVKTHNAQFGASLWHRLSTAKRLGLIEQMSMALAPWRHSETLLSIQLLLTAASRVYFQAAFERGQAQVIVVANDHSPMQVGLCRAANACGLRSVYRQHAPISPLYPPLQFDLSILSDAPSLATYQNRGPVAGETVLLSANLTSPAPIRRPARIAVVGKCLSRVWSHRAVVARLSELCRHPDVTRIILRQHPQDQSDITELCTDPRIMVSDRYSDPQTFARACDLVVIPGSGIALELLHAGTPTIYAGDLDILGHDPHNFVRKGLVPDMTKIPLDNLSVDVVDHFGPAWAQAFSSFDTVATLSPEQMEDTTRVALARLFDHGDPARPSGVQKVHPAKLQKPV